MMALFGLVGYLLPKIGCEPAPLILGFILAPMLEENFRRSLIVSRGSWSIFLDEPICAGFLALSRAADGRVLLPGIRRGRDEAFREEASSHRKARRCQLALVVGAQLASSAGRLAAKRPPRIAPTGGWRRSAAPECRRRVAAWLMRRAVR